MKNKIFRIFKIIIFFQLLYVNNLLSQEDTIILNQPITGNKNYVARDAIKLLPGFSYSAQAGMSFHASIDKFMICNANYQLVIKIYPNPNKGNFTIQAENFKSPYNLVIHNSYGIIVHKSNNITERQKQINLTNLSTGIYLVKIYCDNDIYTKKIIIE